MLMSTSTNTLRLQQSSNRVERIFLRVTMAFTSAPVVAPRASIPSALCSKTTPFGGTPIPSRRVRPSNTNSTRMVFGKTVKQSLQFARNFKTLLALADAAGVDLDVSNCTVFAPNDDSFSRLRPGLVDELLASPNDARAVLLRHILPGKVLTSRQIKGCGFWENIPGGPLGYEGLGPIVKIGNAKLILESSDNECDNGTIHTIDTVLTCPTVKLSGVAGYYQPSIPSFSDSTVASIYPSKQDGVSQRRAVNATLPGTTGGRKAMGLIDQLPFWQYGPPFNAAKQEEYEPISIAQPDVAVGIDYQLMPPGTVIVTPDEVSASKLLPVSGMSKYIGKTQRLVEGDGQSDYSRLDN